MKYLTGFLFKELKQTLIDNNIPANRAYQLFNWIYRKSEFDYDKMSDLPKEFRSYLKENYLINSLIPERKEGNVKQGSIKFLFRTVDNHFIESVLIFSKEKNEKNGKTEFRRTVCLSSQVGCALGCVFCATGRLGFTRNLETHEIISQLTLIKKFIGENYKLNKQEKAIHNVVFMGMGEPLLNYDNVIKAINIMNFSGGLNIGIRRITISTAGIIPGIERLMKENIQTRLAVSVNAGNQEKRKVLMPISKKYALPQLIKTIKKYYDFTKRRITIEYVLIKSINDSENDVISLKRMLHGIKYLLNIIPLNEIEDVPLEKPDNKSLNMFLGFLRKHSMPFAVRNSRGENISAACGQLGLKYKSGF